VASTHNQGVLGRFLSTGVARFLSHNSRASVLFIKPQLEHLPVNRAGFQRILVALDGISDAEVSLMAAADLAAPEQGIITLVRVITEDEASGEQTRAEAASYMEKVAARLRQAGRQVRTAVLRGENVAEAILTYARQQECDLIVLTARRRTWAARAVFGSVADSLLPKAEVPVLLCHSEDSQVAASEP
jgi:nucleotide-binding universal stress UspA family protein